MAKKRYIAIIIIIILCCIQIPVFAQGNMIEKPKEILSALDFLSENDGGRWTAVAINAAGSAPTDTMAKAVKKTVIENLQAYTNVTDIAHDILATAACGYDATKFQNNDLISLLTSNNEMLSQGANGPVYALTALDSLDYIVPSNAVWSREALCDEILLFQNNKGGFFLNDKLDADVDITAYAIIALSPYTDKKNVSDAVAKAVAWLSTNQNEDGTFSSMGLSNSESTSAVTSALISLGIPITNERFTKNNKTPYTALLTFQNSDGGFAHEMQGKSNILATEQAVMAMSAVCFGKSPFKLATVSPPVEKTTLSFSVIFSAIAVMVLTYLSLLLVRKIGERYGKVK